MKVPVVVTSETIPNHVKKKQVSLPCEPPTFFSFWLEKNGAYDARGSQGEWGGDRQKQVKGCQVAGISLALLPALGG